MSRHHPILIIIPIALLTLAGCLDGGDGDDGGSGGCVEQRDCALGERCADGTCTAAACDDRDNPCALGQLCEAATGACVADPGADEVIVAGLGSLQVSPDGSPQVVVDVPPGASSLAVVLEAGADSGLMLASTVRQPTGQLVFDWNGELETNRTDATDGSYTLLVPSTPVVTLEPGRWRMTFLTDVEGGFPVTATAVLKTTAATSATLDLNLWFVGLGGLDATSAPDDQEFQRLLDNLEQRWADAGLRVGGVAYRDITGADAERFRVIDSTRGLDGELYQLFALSADAPQERALDLFFVADISSADGFSLLGLAGGIPGPPLLHGTARSGVAVNMAEWLAAAGEPDALADARLLTELIIAHETGHYLGLYHTTERNGESLGDNGVNGADPLPDTATCPDSADHNGNGILSADECLDTGGGDNLMFWSPPVTASSLTNNQADLLLRNPLVR